jgi:hypothetical protein
MPKLGMSAGHDRFRGGVELSSVRRGVVAMRGSQVAWTRL